MRSFWFALCFATLASGPAVAASGDACPGGRPWVALSFSGHFAEGFEPDARAVAKLLNPAPNVAAMPNPLPVSDLAGGQVLVVVATDLAAQ